MTDDTPRQRDLKERAEEVGLDPDLMLDEREDAGEPEPPEGAEPLDERDRG